MHTVEALDRLICSGRSRTAFSGGLCRRRKPSAWPLRGSWWRWPWKTAGQGDLWRCCIARELVSSENPFSLAWERRSNGQDTLKALALADMKLFFELLNAPPEGGAWPLLRDFRHESRHTADCASFLAFSGELAAAGSPGGAAGPSDGVLPDPGRRSAGHEAGVPGQKVRERRGAGPRGGPSSCASGGSGGLPGSRRIC